VILLALFIGLIVLIAIDVPIAIALGVVTVVAMVATSGFDTLPSAALVLFNGATELIPLPQAGVYGSETVQLTVRLNVGLDAKPLARVASGGELSRLMLALKVVLARHDAVATLVFDEVDQGIGGEVGAQVGAALAQVAEGHQVLVITHLPQIAARADRHLVVSKEARGGIATSDVQTIHGEDRVGEIARMLGDGEGEAARRHAQALLRKEKAARR
jgi:DNA repair protein RecN (Recombination protein N)